MGPILLKNGLVRVDQADTNHLVAAVKKVNIYFLSIIFILILYSGSNEDILFASSPLNQFLQKTDSSYVYQYQSRCCIQVEIKDDQPLTCHVDQVYSKLGYKHTRQLVAAVKKINIYLFCLSYLHILILNSGPNEDILFASSPLNQFLQKADTSYGKLRGRAD